MEPRWEADGVILLDLLDEVTVGTRNGIETTRSRRRRPTEQQWNPEALRMFVGVMWNPRGLINDSPGGVLKRYITRALVQVHGATDGCATCHGDSHVHVPRCRKRIEDIFEREKAPRQPCAAVQQECVQVEQQHEQQQQQQRETVPQQIDLPPQSFSSSHDGPMQVNTTHRRARIPDDEDNTRTNSPTFGHECADQ